MSTVTKKFIFFSFWVCSCPAIAQELLELKAEQLPAPEGPAEIARTVTSQGVMVIHSGIPNLAFRHDTESFLDVRKEDDGLWHIFLDSGRPHTIVIKDTCKRFERATIHYQLAPREVVHFRIFPDQSRPLKIDLTHPEIVFSPTITSATAGKKVSFSAQVYDSTNVADVVFFYRRKGTPEFIKKAMSRIAERSYEIELELESDSLEYLVEYYLLAQDGSCNKSTNPIDLIRPHLFSVAPNLVKPLSLPRIVAGDKKSKRWWLIGGGATVAGLGVVAAVIWGNRGTEPPRDEKLPDPPGKP